MGGGLGVGVVGFYAKQNNKQKNHVGWFLEDGLKGCRFSLLRKKPLFKKVRLGTSKSGFCLWKGICVFVTPFSMPIEQGLFKTCIYSPFFFKALYFVLGSISSNFSRVSRRPSFLEEWHCFWDFRNMPTRDDYPKSKYHRVALMNGA